MSLEPVETVAESAPYTIACPHSTKCDGVGRQGFALSDCAAPELTSAVTMATGASSMMTGSAWLPCGATAL
eukprot:2404518-Rhodomonas_salina.1